MRDRTAGFQLDPPAPRRDRQDYAEDGPSRAAFAAERLRRR